MAFTYFQKWREWNQERALHYCIQTMKEVDSIRQICKAEILAAILYQCCNSSEVLNRERIETILSVLTLPPYEHILQNYIKTYCYEDISEEGQRFQRLLRDFGYSKRN